MRCVKTSVGSMDLGLVACAIGLRRRLREPDVDGVSRWFTNLGCMAIDEFAVPREQK